MFKFCPQCGEEISGSIRFCPECGFNLSKLRAGAHEQPVEERYAEKSFRSKYKLGERLEEAVETIFQAKGYQTERRTRRRGKSGTINEIDVLAKRENKVIAVECKNISSNIRQDHIRNFYVKLTELSIRKGYFASAISDFTSGARLFAQQNNITLWSKEDLHESLYNIAIGRHEQPRRQRLDNALPIRIDFDTATRLNLKNDMDTPETNLIFHPYFSIEYTFKANYHDPGRKTYNFKDSGTIYIDAIDGEVLNHRESALPFFKKIFSKGKEESISKLLDELRFSTETKNYTLQVNKNYTFTKINPEITGRFAQIIAHDHIIKKNTKTIPYKPKSSKSFFDTRPITFTPKKKHIMVNKIALYHIPKWSITFYYKDIDYSREIYAYSGTVIEDTISYCPKHFGQKILSGVFQPKKSVALCEVCGQALCAEHVKQCPKCGKWLCHEHASQCESCNNLFCFNHKLYSCIVDNKPLCSTCISKCLICNRIYSENHKVTCDKCGRIVCPLCTVIEGLISKKHYCVNCK